MEKFLEKQIDIPFGNLYLDPNNPRLALADPPGYDDPKHLFDAKLQERLADRVKDVYQVESLVAAIENQGWMPIDNIVVWSPPHSNGRFVVVEGNTRIVALRVVRQRLATEQKKLEKVKASSSKYAKRDLLELEKSVAQLQRIVADTDNLSVLPMAAKDIQELRKKLPRVLAVRHITGAKGWGNYAEDLWLLRRYESIYSEKHGDSPLQLDSTLINHVANEASLSGVAARRQIVAASSFSHFKTAYEDKLPAGEQFAPSDYYLFENIVKKPWLRTQFGLTDDSLAIPEDFEGTLFKWVFRLPRGTTADENKNVFYRHENVLLWDQMRRYDEAHQTGFASRFDVGDPDKAPTMRKVEAEWLGHKASQQPVDVLEQLLQQLEKLDVKSMASEGGFLKKQLELVHDRSGRILKALKAFTE